MLTCIIYLKAIWNDGAKKNSQIARMIAQAIEEQEQMMKDGNIWKNNSLSRIIRLRRQLIVYQNEEHASNADKMEEKSKHQNTELEKKE